MSLPPETIQKAKSAIEKGRRAKWWRCVGTMKRGFSYETHDGLRITDEEKLDRIKAIVIPPAWRFVRISPAASSPIQAVGMDTTGRVQYLYEQKFLEKRARQKFDKVRRFGELLPALRETTNRHIALDGFPLEKVLAVMMRLINSLYIRVGSEKSVKHYKTFGITTLQNRHLTIDSRGRLISEFVGKSHIEHRKILADKELAAIMKDLKELGRARKLFHYIGEDGNLYGVKPSDVNAYIKSATAPEFSSKDFRTWAGTLLAAVELAEAGTAEDEQQVRSNIVKAVKKVARELGNTPTVCRSSYIHPRVIECYSSGVTLEHFQPRKSRRIRRLRSEAAPEEAALLRMLE